jgi:hypothetical protein
MSDLHAEGFAVQLLTEQIHADFRVERRHRLFGERQHAAGAASRVIDGANDAGAGQRRVVVRKQ